MYHLQMEMVGLQDYGKIYYFIIGKNLPIESQIHKYQDEYYKKIANCNKKGDSTEFIEFILKMIDETKNCTYAYFVEK